MTGRPWELSPYGQAHMDQVLADARNVIEAERQLWASIQAARDAEIPWRFIGNALGITRQAAQDRFSKPPKGQML